MKTDKAFKAFITKCFAENQLDKKLRNKFTKGHISYGTISKYFGISRKTAITNIKVSNAKPFPNIILHKKISFESMLEYGMWLSQNMGTVIE